MKDKITKLTDEQFNSPQNQNRDKAIIGYKSEMKDKKELIEEFVYEWGILKDEEGTYDLRDELKGDVIALIEGLMPTENELYAEIDKLPYTKHLDDGQYNDGQLTGFEKCYYWLHNRILEQLK